MLMRILTVGHHMPTWVQTGYQEYAKRFTAPFRLKLHEITPEKRTKTTAISQIITRESEKLCVAIHPDSHVIALDVKGKSWSTAELATHLKNWHASGIQLDLLIGGPDGMSEACLNQAHTRWSLSPLTLPHPIVRILLAEQLYRATTILKNHPYHRS